MLLALVQVVRISECGLAIDAGALYLSMAARAVSSRPSAGSRGCPRPLRRVPTLVLDNNQVLIDSAYILDWLDEQAGDKALIAKSGPERQKALYYIALTTGFSDKCVALFYEKVLHKVTSDIWLNRCQTQVAAVLGVLEGIRT